MFELPRCTALAADAANALAARLPLSFDLAGASYQAAMPSRQRPRPAPDWHRILGSLGGDAIGLAIGREVIPPAAAAQLGELLVSALPAELRAVLLAVLLRDLDDLVEAWCGMRPEWRPLGNGAAPLADELANELIVTRADAPDAAIALLQFDDGAFARVAERCRERPVRHVRLDDVPVVLDLLFDRVLLRSGELRALKPGDIVVLGREPSGEGGIELILRLPGGPGFRARGAGGSLTLLAALDGVMDLPDTGPAGSLNDIELPVEFTIGRLVLPLSRVRELAVGQVLDLGFDATTAVTLRINGHVVAIGELVRIAERTGVRITELRVERE